MRTDGQNAGLSPQAKEKVSQKFVVADQTGVAETAHGLVNLNSYYLLGSEEIEMLTWLDHMIEEFKRRRQSVLKPEYMLWHEDIQSMMNGGELIFLRLLASPVHPVGPNRPVKPLDWTPEQMQEAYDKGEPLDGDENIWKKLAEFGRNNAVEGLPPDLASRQD